jgi:hypothetical protein
MQDQPFRSRKGCEEVKRMHELDRLSDALRQVQVILREVGTPWLVGGSCGLLLQGVPLSAPPRDLDLYADSVGVRELHLALSAFSTDTQVEDQTPIYRSILSHYSIDGIKVELVGGFEVSAQGSTYKVDADFLFKHFASLVEFPMDEPPLNSAEFESIRLMPLEHELIFNLLRSRPDRYEGIAAVMRSRQMSFTKAMDELILRNDLSESLIQEIERLLLT